MGSGSVASPPGPRGGRWPPWRALLYVLLLSWNYSPASSSTVIVSTIYWKGGSGLWSNASMWSQGRAPVPSDKVLISLDYGETVTLRTNVTVKSLVLTSSDDLAGGGTVVLSSGGLRVTDTLLFARGTISGAGTVSVSWRAYLSDYADKVLAEGAKLVNYGNTSWDEGNVLLRSGGSIVNYGRFALASPASSMQFSDASYYFTSTKKRVLNKEVWLYDVLPHGSAIYDLWSTDAVLPRNQNNMYDLAVLHPDEGSRLYFESVPGVGNSAHPDMYDSSLFNISLDACAQACYDTYSSWCASFDYAATNQFCYLSRYKAFEVGNLTKDSLFSHYELKTATPTPSSVAHFINYGTVAASATYTSFSVGFDNRGSLSVSSSSTLLLLSGGNFSSNASTSIDSTSEVMVGGSARLTWRGSVTGKGTVQVMSGSHQLPWSVSMPGGSLVVSKGATVSSSNTSSRALSLLFNTVDVNGTMVAASLDLKGLTRVRLGSSGNLSADGLGFSGGNGPGAGRYGKEGGSGAAYAGYGGNGKNTSGSVSVYGSYYLTPSQWLWGSGGGGSKYGAGGAGGGRIRVWSSGYVQLQGVVTANGASGGMGGGGGGSGGSVVINATTCSGAVTITAKGGAGGYPYGWISGGGGSGGRVAVYCTAMGMSTNISAAGGSQADQAKASSYTPAAAGTVYQRLGSSGVETLVVDNFGQGSGTAVGPTVLQDSTGQRGLAKLSVLRGARLQVGSSSVSASVNVSGSLVCDGSGSVLVGSGGTLVLPWSATLRNANMSVQDGGRLGGVQRLTVGAGTLLSIDGTAATSGSSAGTFSLARLQVTSGGVLRQRAGSVRVVLSDGLTLLKNSTLYITNLTLQASTLSVYDTSRLSGLGLRPGLYVDSSSVLSFYGRASTVDGGLTVFNRGSVRVRASSSLSLEGGADLVNYGTLVLGSGAAVTDEGTDGAWGSLVNQAGAQVVMNGSSASLDLQVNNTGTINVPAGATLTVTGGFSAYGASLSVNGTLTVVGGSRGGFRLLDGTQLSLRGNITLYNGTLYFPQTLPVKTISGMVTCLDNGTAVVRGGNPSYSFSRVWVRRGGTFWSQVQSTVVGTAVLEAGGTLSVAGGGKLVVSKELRWWGGTIKGSGVVEAHNATTMISSSTKYLLDRVTYRNLGTVTWWKGALVSQQAASLVNYKAFNISGSNQWVTGGDTYYFRQSTNARYPLWLPIVSYRSKSVAQCATLCKAGGLSFAAPRPNGATFMTTVSCWSFNYNRLDGSCDLHMYSASGGGGGPVLSVTTDDSRYDYYELVSNWTSPASGLLNMPGASLTLGMAGSNATLAVNVTNRGTLAVPGSSATLTLSGGGWMAPTATLSLGSGAMLQVKGSTAAFDLGSSFDATNARGTLLLSGGSHNLCPSLSGPRLTLSLDASTSLSSSSSAVSLSVSRLLLSRAASLLLSGSGTMTVSASKLDVASGATLNVSTGRLVGNFTSLSARTKGQLYFSSGSLTVWQNMTVATGGRVSSKDASIKAAYLYVAPTGRLHSDGMGRGPGRGSYGSFGGSGGSYGGKGGKGSSQVSSNSSYGSLFYPTSFGSQGGSSGSGGAGGLGGGRLVLNVTSCKVDGTISASGASGAVNGSAGGSGGSLLIYSTGTFAGSGNLTADGGSGATGTDGSSGGGGGGGRIALYVSGTDLWAGKTSAAGGSGYQAGGAGTVYYRGKGVGGSVVKTLLTISGGSASSSSGSAASTVLSGVKVGSLLSQLYLSNKATLRLSGSNLTVLSISGDGTGTVRVENSSWVSLSSGFSLNSATLVAYQGVLSAAGNVTVGPTGVLLLYEKARTAGASSWGSFVFPTLRVQGTVSVRSTKTSPGSSPVSISTPLLVLLSSGTIEANAAGYPGGVRNGSAAQGYGRGSVGGPGGSGGGHGGQGAPGMAVSTSGGAAYGDAYRPTDWGSGGGASGVANGGRGGGLVSINATTLLLYGTISANGANGSSPGGAGGAGGSVLVRCQGVLKGNGVLTARGGGGTWTTKTYGGGGGGGRIGVWYGTSNFSGSFDVRGGVSVYQATTSVDSGAVSKADDWRASFRASSDQRAAGGTVSLQRASGSGLSVVSFRELMAGNQRLATYSSRGNLRGSLSDSSYNPYPSTPTTTLQTNSSYATDVLRLGGGVSLSLRSFTVLNVSTISAAKRPSLLVSQQSRLVVPANFTVNGFTLDLRSGKLQGGGNLTVLGGGVVSLRRDGWTAFEASPGYYRFTRISLRSNASLVLQDGAQVGKRGVVVTAGSVTVARGAKIHSDGRGYAGGTLATDDASGPCAGGYGERRGEGGGHAGAGGRAAYDAGYGSVVTPLLSGSGGGASLSSAGGAGGGTVVLRVSGRLQVDGSVSVSGQDCPGTGGGAGAGGSVAIIVNGTLSGAGNITAVGGAGCSASSLGGGGAGGRVSLRYVTWAFTGKLSARGGKQWDYNLLKPAAGTVYLERRSSTGRPLARVLTVDSGGVSTTLRTLVSETAWLPLDSLNLTAGASLELLRVNVSLQSLSVPASQARLAIGSGSAVNVTGGVLSIGNMDVDLRNGTLRNARNLTLLSGAKLLLWDTGRTLPVLSGFNRSSYSLGGSVHYLANLDVRSGATLVLPVSQPSNRALSVNLVTSTFKLRSGGKLTVDGYGYAGLERTGTSSQGGSKAASTGSSSGADMQGGAGGGHAGQGADGSSNLNGGSYRGNAFSPVGSGGGGGAGPLGSGGAGGGGVHLVVLKLLTLDGTLSANGQSAATGSAGGGGAGGSVWVEAAGRWGGSGSISADGGDGDLGPTASSSATRVFGGAGSGGRIRLSYRSKSSYSFSGSVSAKGGVSKYEAPVSGALYGNWEESLEAMDFYKMVRAPAGSVLVNTDQLTVDGGSLSYSAPAYPTTLAGQGATVSRALTRISALNRASLSVVSGTTLANLTSLSCDGSGSSISFESGSTLLLAGSSKALSISGCGVTLAGNVSYASRLTVANASTLTLSSTLTTTSSASTSGLLSLQALRVSNRSVVTGSSVYISAGSITLQGGSAIHADALGYAGGSPGQADAAGPGAGGYGDIGGAGGSHGGVGVTGLSGRYMEELKNTYFVSGASVSGLSIPGSALTSDGGPTYGSVYQPQTWGSGGGSGDGPKDRGGAGGGKVRLNVTDTLALYGGSRVSADGESTDAVGGGGAGGSVWVSCSALVGSTSGAEAIRASGGRGGNDSLSVQKGGMWGGGGGGGRVAIYCKRRSGFYGTIEARSGAPSGSLAGSNGYSLGSLYLDSPLIDSLTYRAATSSYPKAQGYYVDVRFNVSRRGPMQVIETRGGGNGTRSSTATNITAVVRGRWRVGYKNSGYSDYLSSQATASEVSAALKKLGTLGQISVDRRANSRNGWSWSVTFHSDVTSPVHSPIYVDGAYLYSTAKNASIRVYNSPDPLTANVSAPLRLSNATAVDAYLSLTGATVGRNYSATWIQPNTLRLVVSNTTAKPSAIRGKLKAQLKMPLPGYYGKYYPSRSTWSPTLV